MAAVGGAGQGGGLAGQAYGPTCVPAILALNPNVNDKYLAGAIGCNMVGFKGSIQVVTKDYQFPGQAQAESARVITISPYGNFVDFVVALKRVLVGVRFTEAVPEGGNAITRYVLGSTRPGDEEHTAGAAQLEAAIAQRRHIIVAVTVGGRLDISIDESKEGCVIL